MCLPLTEASQEQQNWQVGACTGAKSGWQRLRNEECHALCVYGSLEFFSRQCTYNCAAYRLLGSPVRTQVAPAWAPGLSELEALRPEKGVLPEHV